MVKIKWVNVKGISMIIKNIVTGILAINYDSSTITCYFVVYHLFTSRIGCIKSAQWRPSSTVHRTVARDRFRCADICAVCSKL